MLTRLATDRPEVRTVIGVTPRVIPRVVVLLGPSPHAVPELEEAAARALLNLANDCPANRAKILKAGAEPSLTRLMNSSPHPDVRNVATRALIALGIINVGFVHVA